MGLKAAVLRKLGRLDDAIAIAARALELDPMDALALNERYLARRAAGHDGATAALDALTRTLRDHEQSYLELATDYGSAALWSEAIELLERLAGRRVAFASTYPLVHYYLGYFHEHAGNVTDAEGAFRRAAEMPSDYVFPFRLESIDVLTRALTVRSDDHRAHYYLGNLLYEIQPERAIEHWERSGDLFDGFSIVHRNLGWAYYRSGGDIPAAIERYERAVVLDRSDTRLYVELDQLYEVANTPVSARLAMLTANREVVARRSDSLLRALIVQVLAGEYDEAIATLDANRFFVAEGGGRVHDVFVDAHLLRGLARLEGGQAGDALADFGRASAYPDNLSVARPGNDRRAPQVAYSTALAHEALGNADEAVEHFRRAADQRGTARWPDTQIYQALALQKLGETDRAAQMLEAVVRAADAQLAEDQVDFFAKFGTRVSEAARRAQAHYLIGLGQFALGRVPDAHASLERALDLDTAQVWARYHLENLQ